eukprot:237197-Prymnesium_polylepis.2
MNTFDTVSKRDVKTNIRHVSKNAFIQTGWDTGGIAASCSDPQFVIVRNEMNETAMRGMTAACRIKKALQDATTSNTPGTNTFRRYASVARFV